MERERSDGDCRVVTARLSSEGRRLVTKVFPSHAAFVRDAVAHLSPGEQEELRRLFEKPGKGL